MVVISRAKPDSIVYFIYLKLLLKKIAMEIFWNKSIIISVFLHQFPNHDIYDMDIYMIFSLVTLLHLQHINLQFMMTLFSTLWKVLDCHCHWDIMTGFGVG